MTSPRRGAAFPSRPSPSPFPFPRAAVIAAAMLAVAAQWLAAAGARAGEFGLTETAAFRWHADNRDTSTTNDDYFDIKNRLNLTWFGETLEAALRLDTMTIFETGCNLFAHSCDPKSPPGGKYRDDYRVERITGVLKPGGGVKLTMGDFYAQLGAGILLALRKVDEFGMESVLRGAKVDYASTYVSASLMGGVTNINNTGELDDFFAEDPMDRIAALKVSVTPVDRVAIDAHAMVLSWRKTLGQEAFNPLSAGAGLALKGVILPGKLTLQAEFDVVFREDVTASDEAGKKEFDRGEALYVALNGTAGPFSLLVEWKWYEEFLVRGSRTVWGETVYNMMPTAERADQEVYSTETVYGGRIKGDVRLREDLSLYANFSAGDYAPLTWIADGDDSARKAWYAHAYGGMQLFWADGLSQLAISGGYRREMAPDKHGGAGDWVWNAHAYHVEAKLVFALSGGWSFHWTLQHQSRGKKLALAYNEYAVGTQIVGFDLSGVMSLNGAFEYDTELLRTPFERNLFGWWEAKLYPRKGIVILLKGGLERGGLKCVSGVCRVVPAFTGIKADLVYRY